MTNNTQTVEHAKRLASGFFFVVAGLAILLFLADSLMRNLG